MPRPLWKGIISFGLVSIPVELHTIQKSEQLKFHFLHKKDMKPIKYLRGHENSKEVVPWDEIVRGYEYEKGKYVVLTEKDFKRVDVEITHAVNIFEFVDEKEVDDMYFDRPYVLTPQRDGKKAYALLARAMKEMNKIGIAKLVIRKREHLAALIPKDGYVILELMHFANTLKPLSDIISPVKVSASEKEMRLAKQLIKEMSGKFNPADYTDEYKKELLKIIRKKLEGKESEIPIKKLPKVELEDLMKSLRESLEVTKKA